jgi:hypothetical protein
MTRSFIICTEWSSVFKVTVSLSYSFSADERWSKEYPHRPTCFVPGHDAVLSGSMLPTLNKYAASISKADVLVQIFCSNPQIQAAMSTRNMCFVVIPHETTFTRSVAQPTSPVPHLHIKPPPPPHDVYSLSRAVTLGEPLFIQHATELCQRSCRIVVAQNTASGARLKVDVFTSIYTTRYTL